MKNRNTAAALMIAIAAVVGCDSKDETKTTTTTTTPPAVKTDNAMDKMGTAMSNAADATKEKAAEAGKAMKDGAAALGDKATEMKDAAAAKMSGMKDMTPTMTPTTRPADGMGAVSTPTTDSTATLVATAQKYYDQARSYLASNNFTAAGDMISKLDGMKAQLPADWQTKIDDLKAMYTQAKAAGGNLIPKMGN